MDTEALAVTRIHAYFLVGIGIFKRVLRVPFSSSTAASPLSRSETPTLDLPDIESGEIVRSAAQPAGVNVSTTGETRWAKAAKLTCGLVLGVSVSIIIAVVVDMKTSPKHGAELILYRISAGCSLLSFFTGVGLLVSVLVKVREISTEKVNSNVQKGLIAVALLSTTASVVSIAFNAFV